MSLFGVMNQGERFIKIHVSEIRANVNNFYAHMNDEDEEMYVRDMAKQIEENGQDSNAVVYEDESLGDGKKYTLLAGERRWKAMLLNFENGIGDGLMQVKVINKPESTTQEIIRIVTNNAQRDKSPSVRKAEIEALELCWMELCEQGKQPIGKKRDWIAKCIGMSPRQVQEYLTGNFSDTPMQEEEQSFLPEDGEQCQREDINGFNSSELETLKMISSNLSNTLETKVKISKKGAITFTPYIQENMSEVYLLLDKLGFNTEGFYKD